MSPRSRGRRDGFREVELDAEPAAFGFAAQAVAEDFSGRKEQGPDVGFGGGDQFDGKGIGGEILPRGRAGGGGVTAILRDFVLGAVFVAMIVLEPETGGGASEDPRA